MSVGNGRHYGGGMTVEETASADDGKLDFYSLEVEHGWRLLWLLPSLRNGTQGKWDDVRAFRTTAVTVRTSRKRPVNTDGEPTARRRPIFASREGDPRVCARHAGRLNSDVGGGVPRSGQIGDASSSGLEV